MYLQHFGLRAHPFAATPSSSSYVDLSGHEEALNLVAFSLESGEGFTKVVGEVGTGKTLLCRTLLNRLDDRFVIAFIPNPSLGPLSLQVALAEELGIPLPPKVGAHQLLRYLRDELIAIRRQRKQAVVFIDEAQTIPDASLESLRLLSNLELDSSKLIQIVFFAQPEFDERISQRNLRQLQQRISFSHRLLPIDRDAIEAYVSRRLVAAGHSGQRLFTPWALNSLHRASGGIPRLVNQLSHKALLCACAAGEPMVRRSHMKQSIANSEGINRWRRVSLMKRATSLLLATGAAGLLNQLVHFATRSALV